MLKGKKVLLGITGSIAAYKAALLTRLLVKAGAEVKVVMTQAAANFISPLTLSTLSNNRVLSHLSDGEAWSNHVMLGRWADIMLVAPASCNTIAKMASGICDNLLMAVYLSATCTVTIAPAMDEDMWLHPATKRNLLQLRSFGNEIIPVESGELASGLIGEGRMAEPEHIMQWLERFFTPAAQPLKGKTALVTAGPTYEHLDPVRFIGNHSSGKMGIAIAAELQQQGARVTLVLGPVAVETPSLFRVTRVTTAAQMLTACIENSKADIIVMSAAVADYTPSEVKAEKIKKTTGESMVLTLNKTTDILKYLGSIKTQGQVLVGFALETNEEEMYAKKKLADKNADMIVLNSLNDQGAGFGVDTNKITIFEKSGKSHRFDTKPKTEVAKDIVQIIIQYKHEV